MTVSIDTRTRNRSDVRQLSVATAVEALEQAVGRHGALAAEGVEVAGLGPLRIEVDGLAVTLAGDGDGFGLRPDVDAEITVRLSPDGLSDLVQDLQTPMGLAMTSHAEVVDGRFDDWLRWEPTLHALLDGRPVHRPGGIVLVDDAGAPLDRDRSFTMDDDPATAGRFLAEAGFLHVRGVFTPAEMAEVSRDLERALAEATPDDGASWWATDADGTDLPVRVLWFHERSDALGRLLDDDRIRWFGELTDDDLAMDDLGAEGLVKPLHIERGLSDLPWHKDCGQGRLQLLWPHAGHLGDRCGPDQRRTRGDPRFASSQHALGHARAGPRPRTDAARDRDRRRDRPLQRHVAPGAPTGRPASPGRLLRHPPAPAAGRRRRRLVEALRGRGPTPAGRSEQRRDPHRRRRRQPHLTPLLYPSTFTRVKCYVAQHG